MQIILNNYEALKKYLIDKNIRKPFIVCTHSFYKSNLYYKLQMFNKNIIYFDDFKPNPSYDSVCSGLEEFKKNKCDSIIAIGGGSAIDVAKCIKLELDKNIEFIVSPTTAGTGSEATKFAVIYKNGNKTSVEDETLIPNAVFFEDVVLKTLPLYQKKATLLDAFSHAIESIWSVNSTDESKKFASKAIELIVKNMDLYLNNDEASFSKMFEASNLAGKAINITKTTAGHAMCYKLTTLYGISHGHAAMLINSELFPYMIENMEKTVDIRGIDYLNNVFNYIKLLLNNNEYYFKEVLLNLDLYNIDFNIDDIDTLVESVNIERLANNPIKLEKEDIREIYLRLFNKIKESQCESNRFCKGIKR